MKNRTPASTVILYIFAFIFLAISIYMLATAVSFEKLYLESLDAKLADMWRNVVLYLIEKFIPYFGISVITFGLGKAISIFAKRPVIVNMGEDAELDDQSPIAIKLEELREINGIKLEEMERREKVRLEETRSIILSDMELYRLQREEAENALMQKLATILARTGGDTNPEKPSEDLSAAERAEVESFLAAADAESEAAATNAEGEKDVVEPVNMNEHDAAGFDDEEITEDDPTVEVPGGDEGEAAAREGEVTADEGEAAETETDETAADETAAAEGLAASTEENDVVAGESYEAEASERGETSNDAESNEFEPQESEASTDADAADDTEEADTADEAEEADAADEAEEADTADDTEEADTADGTEEAGAADDTEEAGAADDAEEAGAAEEENDDAATGSGEAIETGSDDAGDDAEPEAADAGDDTEPEAGDAEAPQADADDAEALSDILEEFVEVPAEEQTKENAKVEELPEWDGKKENLTIIEPVRQQKKKGRK